MKVSLKRTAFASRGQSFCNQTGSAVHICMSPGCWQAAHRVPSDEIFFFNQGNEKTTDGRYSLRGCLNPVARKGEGVGTNVSYT